MPAVERKTEPRSKVDGVLAIEVAPEGETTLIRASGELDMSTTAALAERLNEVLSSAGGIVVLDLEHLEFIDVAGIRCLVHAANRSRADGDRLRIAPGNGQIERVLTLTGLARRLPLIHES